MNFPTNGTSQGHVSLLVFNFKDEPLIGIPDPSDPNYKLYVCDDKVLKMGKCNETQRFQYILMPGADSAKSYVMDWSSSTQKRSFTYQVNETGYYCAFVETSGVAFYATVDWKNAFGKLPAWQYPKLIVFLVWDCIR